MMAENILVSVIIISYNHERYIEQAVSSVLMQDTNFKYEILIGDDASTDRTPEILKKLQQKNPGTIRLFLRRRNLGATKNAYELLMNAKGKYLATCEGDDYWISKDKLRVQVEFLEKNQSFIGCSHDYIAVDQNGSPLKKQRLRWICNKTKYTFKDFKGIMLPGQATTIVRRNIYLDTSQDYSIFYKAHRQIGDRTTILLYAPKGDFYHFREKMSCYRRYKGSGNLTSMIYDASIKSIKDDFIYTKTLDEYAVSVLKVDADFQVHKSELLTSAIFHYIKTRDKAWLDIAKEIFDDIEPKRMLLLYIPCCIIKKMIYRLFYLD